MKNAKIIDQWLRARYANKNITDLSDQLLTYHAMIKAVDDGMRKLVNKMKNNDRETIFIFSSDNGAVQIFDNPDKAPVSLWIKKKIRYFALCINNAL